MFASARVPAATLLSYLERGSVEEFAAEFPAVTREQALEMVLLAGKKVLKPIA